ncbi:putative minor capsid protein [Yasminevirus sp. GU-2018]|uniref:Putative minor capsid protein n=1 Tax=Yasminevirus sp. GU-2018 TaxID=2420051 RepID=A0A5K0U9Z5_9VIRU|nr:putative minor capsid protein [Yasminevirus sp. GU-2018]
MTDTNIIATASRAVPEENTFMFGHIGGIGYAGGTKVNKDDVALDTDSTYTREQEKLIDRQNDKLYKRDQHNESFDLPPQGYNHISQVHPLGINMVANHGDKGFDYRDFPRELAKDRELFDPYIGYLHKNGLIGKNKSRYTTNYVNVDSSNRDRKSSVKTKFTVRLDSDPLMFNGLFMRIYMPNTDQFSLNDKVTISGVTERELTMRSVIIDDFGTKVNYFLTEENKQYMTVSADNNMQINSGFTTEIKDLYTDMMVDLRGFAGDKKTEWYFDTRQYRWEFQPSTTTSGQPAWILKITEDVYAVTSATASLPESAQVKAYMPIAEFKIDMYGSVVEIKPGIPYNLDDLRWTEPPQYAGQGGPPQIVEPQYYQNALSALTSLGLDQLPSLPTTIYKTMEYFDKVQNTIRSAFLDVVSVSIVDVDKKSNFTLRYLEANKIYPTTVRIVVPEATKVTTTTMVGNISLNMLNAKHRMYLTSADVERDLGIYNVTTTTTTDTPMTNKFYVKLNTPFSKKKFEFANPLLSGALLIRVYEESKSDVTIRYRHFGGVPIKMINAEFPIGFKSVAGFKYVRDIVKNNYIVVELDRLGFLDKRFGGDSIYVSLIEDIDVGYPNPNSYSIDLERVYTNVVMVRMVSSAFPVTQKVIMNGLAGGRKNNRFYWQNVDDGDVVYKIELEPGNYSYSELKTLFESEVSKVQRVGDNISRSSPNHIFLNINEKSGVVTFASYNLYEPMETVVFVKKIKLSTINEMCTTSLQTSSSIAIPLVDPEDVYYQYPFGDYFKNFPASTIPCDAIRIKISHPGHTVSVGQKIVITDALNYEEIPAKYLNKVHIVTRVSSDSYDILLTGINSDPSLDTSVKGGEEVKIYTPNIFRIRFDFTDTFGKELGFRDVGEETSITPYLASISNNTPYDDEDALNIIQTLTGTAPSDIEVSNMTIHNSLNLSGPQYILLTCSEIPKSKGLGVIKDYFYKINLDAPLGEIAYDTFVDSPIFLNDPVDRLNRLTIDVYAPDGTRYDFGGVDHSFVLEIVTYDEIPEGTSISS